MADLSAAIERLRASSQRLNVACDTAAQVVRETEAFLEEANVGVPVWIEVKRRYEDDEGQVYTDVLLGYGRCGSGKFRMVVGYDPSESLKPGDMTVRPWMECSREDKLDSFGKLPDLLILLAKRAEEQAAKAEQSVSAVTTTLPIPKKRRGG